MDYILHMQDGTELYHHGIKGQKWGVRRYQNPDGTLTEAGKRRYYDYTESNRYKNANDKNRDKIETTYWTERALYGKKQQTNTQ